MKMKMFLLTTKVYFKKTLRSVKDKRKECVCVRAWVVKVLRVNKINFVFESTRRDCE